MQTSLSGNTTTKSILHRRFQRARMSSLYYSSKQHQNWFNWL